MVDLPELQTLLELSLSIGRSDTLAGPPADEPAGPPVLDPSEFEALAALEARRTASGTAAST